MQFSFTSEQEEFRSILRRFLEDKSPPTVVRRLMETEAGWDRESWRELNQQLGLTAVHIPEAYGGQGFGPVELGIVLEEMGRALLCAPYFASTVLAATAIMNAGTEAQKRDLLPGIAAGDTIATLAFTEPNGRWDADGIELTATAAGGKYRLDGVKSFVLDGHTADLIVVVATGDKGLSFFTVPGDAPGLTRRALKVMDPTRKQARLEFRGVRGGTARRGRQRRGPVRANHDAGRGRPGERDGGGRREAAAVGAGLRQPAGAVRPHHRLVPVDEAQASRHAGGRGACEVGRLCRAPRRQPRTTPICRRSRPWRRPARRKRICRRPYTRSRSMAASASPGTTTRTYGSSARRAPRCSSAIRRIIAS